MSFTVSKSGTYVIKIENGNVLSEEKETVVVKKEKKKVVERLNLKLQMKGHR